MAFSCSGCANKWTGFKQCHCPTCHLTFSTPGNFDLHRVGKSLPLKCADPEEVELVQNSYGIYRKADERDFAEEMHGRS